MESFDKYGQSCGEFWRHPGMFVGDSVFHKKVEWAHYCPKEEFGLGIIVDFDGYDKYRVRWSKAPRSTSEYESCLLEKA